MTTSLDRPEGADPWGSHDLADPRASRDDLAKQQAFDQLAAAVARVTHDTRDGVGQQTVEEAIQLAREELDFEDLQILVAAGDMPVDLAAAYATVLDAAEQDLSPAVTSHADGILDGQFGSAWWEPGDEVVVAEDEDAAAACAAATSATAAAAAAAREAGDEDVVAVVVVEDVEAACDEDGGF